MIFAALVGHPMEPGTNQNIEVMGGRTNPHHDSLQWVTPHARQVLAAAELAFPGIS
jgi:hypothetical protein